MDRQAMVRDLTKRGILVTPEMLEGGGPDAPRAGPAGHPPGQGSRPRARLSVSVSRPPKLSHMSAEDFISHYSARYGGLRDILLKRMQAVSISNASGSTSEVSVIGMVRERNQRGFVLEDTTGEIPVISEDDVREDDVVGVRGVVREGRLFQSELLWPGIPEGRESPIIPGLSLLLSCRLDEGMRDEAGSASLVFVPQRPTLKLSDDEERRLVTDLPNPCHTTIRQGDTEFRLLIYRPSGPVSRQDALDMLRRRHLSPERAEISTRADPYLVEPVPDLFWIISGERLAERHMGVTLLMAGEGDAVRYDAEKGEAAFTGEPPAQQARA